VGERGRRVVVDEGACRDEMPRNRFGHVLLQTTQVAPGRRVQRGRCDRVG
jgi:hypothetical protein